MWFISHTQTNFKMECLQSTSLSFSSVIRGHHVYKTSWTPYLGEELVLAAEESNLFDRHAVAVLKNGEIVGHMPQELARFSWFLKRDDGSIKAVVTGKRKKGLGLEVPCDYKYRGPQRMMKKLEKLLSQL